MNSKTMNQNIPQGLSSLAGDRDLITTRSFSKAINKAEQTIRKEYCLKGEAFGIKPIKLGNQLFWPVIEIAKLIRGDL